MFSRHIIIKATTVVFVAALAAIALPVTAASASSGVASTGASARPAGTAFHFVLNGTDPIATALPTPVLGWKHAFTNGEGFGTVKPALVYLGGDPTGEVKSINWRRWGDSLSLGYGRGWCPGQSVASGHPCAAKLRIFDIGGCHGHRAYRRLQFFFRFRPHRPWRAEARYNSCNGAYLGSG